GGQAPQPAAVPPAAPPVLPVREKPAVADAGDPQLLALFLEEAREEAARIAQNLPAWDQDPTQLDALVASRRAFHTLKGSGRVVGATALAEFAWSAENLLNRLLDKTLTRSPAILGVLREAIAAAVDPVAVATRAHALAAGRSATAPAGVTAARAPASAATTASPPVAPAPVATPDASSASASQPASAPAVAAPPAPTPDAGA